MFPRFRAAAAVFLWPGFRCDGFLPSSPAFVRNSQPLCSGRGCGDVYTWEEDSFEMELSVLVPPETRAKDLDYKVTSTSISLELASEDGGENTILLDPRRKLRGRIVVDGTFWVLGDVNDPADRLPRGPLPWMPEGVNATQLKPSEYRQMTITIEKNIPPPKNEMQVVDYDWMGVYSEEITTNVTYDEPEDLNVREYAASLGVDIDNINMSLVDKTMFSSGVNLTQAGLDQLKDKGLVQEVTQQADGSEWLDELDDEGNPKRTPFSPYQDSVSPRPGAARGDKNKNEGPPKIPFLDTDSPWHKTIPVDKKDQVAAEISNKAKTEKAQAEKAEKMKAAKEKLARERQNQALDPIDTLTVKRLKDVLRAQGLPLGGNKADLQARLRAHVQSLAGKETTTSDSGDA